MTNTSKYQIEAEHALLYVGNKYCCKLPHYLFPNRSYTMNFEPTPGDCIRIEPAKKEDSLNFARVEVHAIQEDPYHNQSRHLKN